MRKRLLLLGCVLLPSSVYGLGFTVTSTGTTSLMTYGDSKTWLMGWQSSLQSSISAGGVITPVDSITLNGGTVATMKARVDADLAALTNPITPAYLLFNLGVNDVSQGLPAEATWKANAGYILDAFHTRWPSINVYVMKVWDRQGPQNDLDTLNTWIDAVVAARVGWAHVGPNEQVWLEGGDDGATMTYDGVHYSASGNAACAAQWKTVLGI